MAKTPFVHGTIVTPEFLDKIFLYNGGHVHDGDDFDGHAAKINLETHTTGKIDLGTQTKGKIDLASQVTGILPAENGGSSGGGSGGGSSLQLVSTLELLPNHPTWPTTPIISEASGPIAIYLMSIPSPAGSSAAVNLAVVVTPWFRFVYNPGHSLQGGQVAATAAQDALPLSPVDFTLPGTITDSGNGGGSVTPNLTGRLMDDNGDLVFKLTAPSPEYNGWYVLDVKPAMAWYPVAASV
jgi:hypothetical protein